AVAAGAHPLGARRLRPSRAGGRDAEEAQEPLGRPRVPHRPWLRRQGGPGLAQRLPPVPRSLHGRHRYLHARALALRSRACALVARVALRAAARRGGTHRMEKRRTALRLGAAVLGLAALGVDAAAAACNPPLEGTRLESQRFVL